MLMFDGVRLVGLKRRDYASVCWCETKGLKRRDYASVCWCETRVFKEQGICLCFLV